MTPSQLTHGRLSHGRLAAVLAAGLWLALGLGGAACSPASPALMSPPVPDQPFEETAVVPGDEVIKKKITVLFVLDNSPSMKDHLAKLRENAPKFAEEFARNAGPTADFKIGVVKVWDKDLPASCGVKGRLETVKGLTCSPASAISFVQRDTNRCEATAQSDAPYVAALAATMNVETLEVERRAEGSAQTERLCGPEDEQLYDPALEALKESVNPGFNDADASLALVFVTDSNSSTTESVNASQFRQQLLAMKGGDASRIKAYAVMSKSANCAFDPGGPHARWGEKAPRMGVAREGGELGDLGEFVRIMSGKTYDLCSDDWGSNLAEIGQGIGELTRPISDRLVKRLRAIPDLERTHVYCGAQEIPRDGAEGWAYEPSSRQIVIPTRVLRRIGGCSQVRITSVSADRAVGRGEATQQ